VTGARVSQLARIELRDLQVDRLRVMMPSSKKGNCNLWSFVSTGSIRAARDQLDDGTGVNRASLRPPAVFEMQARAR
jgi:hypothetical protein